MCIVQVSVPGLQARYGHRAAAFSITPALTLVTIFGGRDSNRKLLANTTVLEFGESTCMLVSHSSYSQALREATP